MESLVKKTITFFHKDQMYDFFEEILERTEVLTYQQEVIQRAFINGLESLSNLELDQVKLHLKFYSLNNSCPICKNERIKLLSDFIYVEDFGMCPACDHDSDFLIV